MSTWKSLTLPKPGRRFALPPRAREIAYALLAAVLGWLLGQALASRHSDLVASAVVVGVCIFFTLQFPLQGLLLALVSYPLASFLYLNIDLPSGVPDISLLRAVSAITFALVLARGATGRRPFLRLTWVDICMALTVVGLGIATVRSTNITENLQWLLDVYVIPYMIYYVVKNLTVDRTAMRWSLRALAVIGAYCGAYGIYTQTTGNILFVGEGGVTGPIWYSQNLRIMRGLLDSPHVFGLVFSLAIPMQFYLLIKARTRWSRLLYALMLAVTMGGLFFTYKRTAWVATMSSLLVIMFFFRRFRYLLLALVVVAAGILILYSDQITDSAVATERLGQGADTLNGRLELWNTALQEWQQAPWMGYGFGGFFARTSLKAIESQYLWILVDAGLLGFVPYILIFVLTLAASIRLYRARAAGLAVDPDVLATFWGSFVAYLVSLSTVIMNHELPHCLFFLLAGAVAGAWEAMPERQPRVQPTALRAASTSESQAPI